ncbi:MAG: hypothetical protein WC479_09950 [Candidatus Izemoplasmatales bacterium]
MAKKKFNPLPTQEEVNKIKSRALTPEELEKYAPKDFTNKDKIDVERGGGVSSEVQKEGVQYNRVASGSKDIWKEGKPVEFIDPATDPTQMLAAKQQAELQQIDLLKNNKEPLTTYERNVDAGLAFERSIASNLGIKIPDNLEAPTGVGSLIYAARGVLATTGIAGFSLSTLFNPASGNIKQLQGDISNNVSESKRITSVAISKGANLQQAIDSLNILEQSTRFKYNAAQVSLRESPKDVREGLDLQDEMSRNLRMLVENRQLLERYALTGDPNEVLLWQGTQQVGATE